MTRALLLVFLCAAAGITLGCWWFCWVMGTPDDPPVHPFGLGHGRAAPPPSSDPVP